MQTYVALFFLHLCAVVIWVGGMAAMHFAVRPTATEMLDPAQRLPFMTATLGRFFKMALASIVILLASGGWMMALLAQAGAVPINIHIMATLGVIMAAVFGHIRFALYRRLRGAVASKQWQVAAEHLTAIKRAVILNLVLGFITIGVATVGRTLLS